MTSPLKKIEYDKTVDALYIYASKAQAKKTYKISPRVFFDVDKKGHLVGIEVLDASEPFSLNGFNVKAKTLNKQIAEK